MCVLFPVDLTLQGEILRGVSFSGIHLDVQVVGPLVEGHILDNMSLAFERVHLQCELDLSGNF